MDKEIWSKMSEGQQIGYVVKRVIGLIIFLILFFGSWVIIPSGHRGVITNFVRVSYNIMSEGFHFKVPIWDDIHKVSVSTQTVHFDNKQKKGDETEQSSLFAASKDLQDVQIAVVVNYHQSPEKVNKIFQQYASVYQPNVIEPIIRESVKSRSALFTAEELVTKRLQFSDEVSKLLSEKLAEKDAIFERFNVVNFEFSESFAQAIEAKVTAEQQALQAKNKLEQVKFEAEQRITAAKAEAEAIRIQAQAITQQGGREYVNLKWVEKWNGNLPNTVLGDAIPLVNIGQ